MGRVDFTAVNFYRVMNRNLELKGNQSLTECKYMKLYEYCCEPHDCIQYLS